MIKKLSIMDNWFLQAESREAPFHVGGLQIFKLPKGAKRRDFYRKIMDNLGELTAVTPLPLTFRTQNHNLWPIFIPVNTDRYSP